MEKILVCRSVDDFADGGKMAVVTGQLNSFSVSSNCRVLCPLVADDRDVDRAVVFKR